MATPDVSAESLAAMMMGIQAGDPAAMRRFYDATAKRVYSSAMRLTGNVADAQDVTCEVYLRIWRTAARFDAARGQPIQWVMVMARSCAIDRVRRRRLAARALAAINVQDQVPRPWAMAQGPERDLQQLETTTLLRRHLARLPVVQREIVSLAFLQELSHSEIAARTDLPLGTVKSHIYRALRALRRMLSEGLSPCA